MISAPLRGLNENLPSLAPLLFCSTCLALLLIGPVSPGHAAPIGIGTVGDSLTDEYEATQNSFYGVNPLDGDALNWVEQLAATRTAELDFGSHLPFPGSLGEPRNHGYSQNWARAGATATGPNNYDLSFQVPGLGPQVASNQVDLVVVEIGSNDIGFELADIATGVLSGAALAAHIDNVANTIGSAVDTLLAAGNANVVMVNTFDWTATPNVRSNALFNPTTEAIITAVIVDLNGKLQDVATARGLPLVDVYGLVGLALEPTPVNVGGVDIVSDAPTNRDPSYFFLPDGTHPETVWQGLFGNAILTAFNEGYGANLSPLSDQEILALAGITDPNPGGSPTFFDVSGFVTVVPEPSSFALALIAGMCILFTLRRDSRSCPDLRQGKP